MTNNQGTKIAITGANSAVGQAILQWELQRRSTNTIVAAVRSARAVQQIQGLLNSLGGASSAAQISYDDSGTLNAALSGASAVIHLAGILVERPGSSYEQANVVSTRSVVDAARHNSLRKIVLISAIGANEKSRNRYYRTKGEAEAIVRNSGICYTILRAPLLLGPGTEGAAALARNSRGDSAKLIAGGHHLQQPLHVADLAHGAIAAAEGSVGNNCTLDFVGPVALPERELVERAARLQGHAITIGAISKRFLSILLGARQLFGSTGFSRDALEVISTSTKMDPQPAVRELGIDLTGIDQMIEDSLSQGSRA